MEKKKCLIKGITWRDDKQKWIVRTTVNGSMVYGGVFSELSEAEKKLKEINPKLFRKKINRNDPVRKQEIKDAKAKFKKAKIRGIKYALRIDRFEVKVKWNGEKQNFGYCYSPNIALKKYNYFNDVEKYYNNRVNRRRGIKPNIKNEEWISFIYINGKRKEIGRFEDYLDAFDATVRAENENPDFDLI